MSEGKPIDTPADDVAELAAPDQIDGWWERPEVEPAEDIWQLRERRRKRVVTVAVAAAVMIALVLAVGGAVWMANVHYERGKRAFAIGAYDWAVSEFSAARILVFPYRDAAGEERAARAALVRQASIDRANDKIKVQVLATYRDAGRRLAADDTAGVRAALQSARAQLSNSALGDDPDVQEVVSDLQTRVRLSATWALEAGRWRQAASYASLVLLLDPTDHEAKDIARKAAAGMALQARFATALAASRAHEWTRTLTLALSVLHTQPGFPGAAHLVAAARAALRPRPATTRGSNPAAATAAAGGGAASAGSGSSQPPPP